MTKKPRNSIFKHIIFSVFVSLAFAVGLYGMVYRLGFVN